MHQIIHVDYMCNECGNCKSFCPYDSAPYLDKFTLFGKVLDYVAGTTPEEVPEGLRGIIDTVIKDYGYLLMK